MKFSRNQHDEIQWQWQRLSSLHGSSPKPVCLSPLLMTKDHSSPPLIHLFQSVVRGGLVAVFAELINKLLPVFQISPAAVKCLLPILASCFVDTVSARIVLFERVNQEIIEPIISHLTFHTFPRNSTSFVDLDNVWFSLEGSSIEK